eukprot:m.182876 g.182876  ORF g.182876 m.182876 type:complete len:58 (+) comp39297_c0_seq4:930-1103(+)
MVKGSHQEKTFADLVASKKIDNLWMQISLKTLMVMEACLKSGNQQGTPVEIPKLTDM